MCGSQVCLCLRRQARKRCLFRVITLTCSNKGFCVAILAFACIMVSPQIFIRHVDMVNLAGWHTSCLQHYRIRRGRGTGYANAGLN
jgi:hypothetical protein